MIYSLMQLNQIATDFVQKEYNIELKIPVTLSTSMKRNLGVFITRNHVPYKIQLSKNLLEYQEPKVIIDVLYHECIHYSLYMLNLPYKDGDDYFEKELRRLGINSTYTYKHKGIVHLYKCPTCQLAFYRYMKGYEKRYICKRCRSKFIYVGEEVQK